MFRRLLVILALASSESCFAQANVGELTQQGGTKLSREDLVQLHGSGINYGGTLPSGAQFTQLNKQDGSASGNIVSSRGSSGLFGKWTIDETGKLCLDMTVAAGGAVKGCNF